MALAGYQNGQRIEANIRSLVNVLHLAADTADMIETEWKENGNDSLANIDYGAELNTLLDQAREWFKRIDDANVFTMGNVD